MKITKDKILPVIALVAMLTPTAVYAQDFVIYPNKDQSQEQQEKDKFECYQYGKDQTGFDPMALPTASAPPPAKEEPKGGVGKGAVRGAVTGLAVGAIAGDAGKGAAIGATAGGLGGGMRRNDQKKQEAAAEEQWAQDQTNEYAAKRNNYNRNYVACMEGRGYTVK